MKLEISLKRKLTQTFHKFILYFGIYIERIIGGCLVLRALYDYDITDGKL